MDDRAGKALDFASDSCKQLITLATGIIALSVTFTKDFVGEVSGGARSLLVLSWLAFLVSVVFGVWLLLALTTSLASSRETDVGIPRVRIPAALQVITFLVGLALVVAFGASVM